MLCLRRIVFTSLFVLGAVAQQKPDSRGFVPAEGRRVALVIGNNAYRAADAGLVAAVPDAKAVAAALPGLGFEPKNIVTAFDADLAGLKAVIRRFIENLGNGDTALVYYAGHGVEVRGRNYLLPVDFKSDASELEVIDSAYSAQELLERLESSGAKARILILDACRNNPLRKRGTRGLSGMDGSGTLVVFPTGSGKVTPDNGIFRRELLSGLAIPGISADDAFKRIGRAVYRASKGDQTPAIYGLLLEDVTFVPGPRPGTIAREGPQVGGGRTGRDGLRYMYVPAGTFRMGCSEGDNKCAEDELPSRDVQITNGFWMGQTEVTVDAYKRFVAASGRKMPEEPVAHFRKLNERWSNGSMPMVMVDWNDANAYCEWAGLRLPTEAEWEYAARGGTTGKYYGKLMEIAWFADNSGKEILDSEKLEKDNFEEYRNRVSANGTSLHSVALKAPNGFGLYDMLGNAAEWTADRYGVKYQKDSRVARGGAYDFVPTSLRASHRIPLPSLPLHFVGLRCVGE